MSLSRGMSETIFKTVIKLFKVKLVNPEKQPDGAVLVCSNHISNVDPVVIRSALTLPVHFMAKKELFRIPIVSTIIKAFGAFSIERGAVDMSAMKTAIEILNSGNAVGMFPQGTRTGGCHPRDTVIKSGVGMILSRVQCDVLPVAILMKKNKFCFGRTIYVVVGDVIEFDSMGFTEKSREEFDRLSKLVFDRVCDLYDEYSYLINEKR